MIRLPAGCATLALLLATPQSASARPSLGTDNTACDNGQGPAILANITGMKDRKGRLKLELYPATTEDFLKDDRDLIAQGKLFRRVWAETPASGPVSICIKVPHEGRYALFFTHDRDGKNKFNFWSDGGGVPGNVRLGRARPKLETAIVDAHAGITTVNIIAQYLRGLGGFAPSKPGE
ncbi:MAG: DUF2141 domain-containing protein [Sphingomonas sp.]|jgi:uncharacterized protein (DUF2141 family)